MDYPVAMRGRDDETGEFFSPSRSQQRRAALDVLELGEQLGIAYETKAEKALKAQLQEKEEHIKELESQLRVYKQIHKVTE